MQTQLNSFNRGLVSQTGVIPSGTQFFQDAHPLQVLEAKSIITEGIDGQEVPAMRVRGLFQLANDINANSRIYRVDVLREAVDAIQDDVNNRSVFGEYDHPSDAKIHLDRISHLITKIWMDGKKVYGEAEILTNTIYGGQLKAILEHKAKIGVSSRGVGDINVINRNGEEIGEIAMGYRFITWDAVAEPSVSGATLNIAESRLRTFKGNNSTNKQCGILGQDIYESMIVKEFDDWTIN